MPVTGAGSVALNVTITQPTGAGFLTVFPTGSVRPTASSVNYVAGQTIPNMVMVKLGSAGQISLFNAGGGGAHVIVDVLGWFPTADAFNGLNPARLFDTRPGLPTIDGAFSGGGALRTLQVRSMTVAGRGGVPASGAGSVALNVTVTGTTASGFLTVYPTGSTRPTASNLNFRSGATNANMVIVPMGVAGQVSVFNGSGGDSDVIVDVLGWFPTGPSFTGLNPTRVFDSRADGISVDGRFVRSVGIRESTTSNLVVAGRGGVPATNVGAVALNVTVTAPTANGFLTVYPAGSARPTASNLNFTVGQTIPNMVIVPVGSAGEIAVFNSQGNSHVVIDILGWFPNPTDPPTRYGNELTLRPGGVGTILFGASPSTTVPAIQAILGTPASDATGTFIANGDGTYRDEGNEYTYTHPVGRQVCFRGDFCLHFGGASSSSVTFTGWSYYEDSTPYLFDADGVSIGARPSDFPGAINYSAGGCYSFGFGTSRSGLDLALVSFGVPFEEFLPDGTNVANTPPPSDVYVTGLTGGSTISSSLDC